MIIVRYFVNLAPADKVPYVIVIWLAES